MILRSNEENPVGESERDNQTRYLMASWTHVKAIDIPADTR
ncbi:MAG: hypothetical protein VYA30_06235 [Myxococcota bacterium]|nr:hypothetical protein [Myxococcota bacterium]